MEAFPFKVQNDRPAKRKLESDIESAPPAKRQQFDIVKMLLENQRQQHALQSLILQALTGNIRSIAE